jgi:two-component sensor histidine kinase
VNIALVPETVNGFSAAGYHALTRAGGSREMKRSFSLHASLDTLPVSRRAVDETLWYLGHRRVEIARIAVDELVGNAINHGHLDPTDDIVLDINASSDRARIEVTQPTIIPDARVRKPGELGAGLGLRIVSSLADRWGFEAGPPGVVWFEVGPAWSVGASQ